MYLPIRRLYLGLRFDDLFDPMEDMDIKEALRRLPREVVDARHQRLLRAMDLSMKHQYLPDDLQVWNVFLIVINLLFDEEIFSVIKSRASDGGAFSGKMYTLYTRHAFELKLTWKKSFEVELAKKCEFVVSSKN